MARKTTLHNSKAKNILEKEKIPKKESASIEQPLIKFYKSKIILVVIVVLIFAVLYYCRSLLIVATVNGQPISRISLVQELEKQSGKQTLNNLVTKMLIIQEAKQQNININKNKIDDEIKKIEANLVKQGQTLDQVLLLQGMTKESLIEQITIQKMVEEMVGKNITVTDKEINEYLEKNKSSIPEGKKPEDMKEEIKQQLIQQKTSDKFQTWLEELQKKAKINYFIQY